MKAEFLKKLKDESKLTTKQISELSGIPESTISRIMSGQTVILLSTPSVLLLKQWEGLLTQSLE